MLLLALPMLGCAATTHSSRPPARTTRTALAALADGILRNGTFQFVDGAGHTFARPEDAPADARLKLQSPYNDWRYWNGVMNIALIRFSQATGDPKYAAFARRNVAFAFDHYPYFERRYDGQKWSFPFAQRFVMEELDDYGAMGASVLEVNRLEPQARYRAYLERAGEYALTRQNRLADGTFVRAFPRRWTLWTDDLYMSLSLLARMGELTGDARYFDDAARQVIGFNALAFDPVVGLMRHNWYSDPPAPGVAFWGRANGWALVAQVDLLDRLPSDHPARARLLMLLRRHVDGVARYQSPSGLWHQVLDHDDSYLETSASAMFAYTIARAVNGGYLPRSYATVAHRGWAGVLTRIRPDGQVEGVCTGTGVSDNLQDYYNRPAPLNDVHGLGTVLLAGTEMMKLRD